MNLKRLLILVILIYCLFWFLFSFVYIHIDSPYYLNFAKFITTGSQPFTFQYDYQRPMTFQAPLYSFVLALCMNFVRSDIALHFVQLTFLGLSTWILFHSLSYFLNTRFALIVALIYLLLPSGVIYASYIMTETLALLMMTVLLFIIAKYLTTSHTRYLALALLWSAVMTLTRYQYFFIYILTWGHLIVHLTSSKFRHLLSIWLLPITISVLIIGSWVFYNHSLTGVWGLSDSSKLRFHTAFVYWGRHYPPDDDPAVVRLNQYFKKPARKYAPWWELHDQLYDPLEGDWRQIDQVIGDVGVAAIRHDPLGYITNSSRIFVSMHTQRVTPWRENLYLFGTTDPREKTWLGCVDYEGFLCGKPVVMTNITYPLWNKFVRLSTWAYKQFFPEFILLIFIPAILIILAFRHRQGIVYITYYLFPLVASSFTAQPESRYLVTYYPLILLIVALAFELVFHKSKRIFHYATKR